MDKTRRLHKRRRCFITATRMTDEQYEAWELRCAPVCVCNMQAGFYRDGLWTIYSQGPLRQKLERS